MTHPPTLQMPIRPANEIKVEAFLGTVVALCACGNRRPVVVPVIPGAGGAAQCNACQTIWRVVKIHYDEVPGEQPRVNVSLSGHLPNIIAPKIHG